MGLLNRTRSKISYKLKYRNSNHGEPIYYGDDLEPQFTRSSSDGSPTSSRRPSARQILRLSRGSNSPTDTDPPAYDSHTTVNPGNPSSRNEVRPEYTDIAHDQGQHWGDVRSNSAVSYFHFRDSTRHDSQQGDGLEGETEDGTAYSGALDEVGITSPLQGAGNGLAEYRGMGAGLDRRVTGGAIRPPLVPGGSSEGDGGGRSTQRMTVSDAQAARRPFTTTRTLCGIDD